MNTHAATLRTLGAALILGLLSLAGAGCGGAAGDAPDTPDSGPDANEDGAGADAALPESGVTLQYAYLGPGREPVSGDERIVFENFSIEAMAMQVHGMELVADTVRRGEQVSDSRVLDYPWSSAPSVNFRTAPPGRYSWLGYRVEKPRGNEELPPLFEGEKLSIRVVGRALVDLGDGQVEVEFEYADDKRIDVELVFDQTFELGKPGTESISVQLDLGKWFAVVDWQALADQVVDGDTSGDDGGEDGGPGGDGGPGDGGPGDGGAGDGDGGEYPISIDGDAATAAMMRESLRTSFVVVGPAVD